VAMGTKGRMAAGSPRSLGHITGERDPKLSMCNVGRVVYRALDFRIVRYPGIIPRLWPLIISGSRLR
jgi:hypothetical protein